MTPMVSKGSESSVSTYWDQLTDKELLAIPWYVVDPRRLPNLRTEKPAEIGDFQIELEYELNHSDKPVRCVHCPQHQKHWHGFVLKDGAGARYCVGSQCGPKVYGADYRVAHRSRSRAKRRFDALVSWKRIYDALPDLIEALVEAQTCSFLRATRRARGAFEARAPRLLGRLRQMRRSGALHQYELSYVRRDRDLALEAQRQRHFDNEVLSIVSLPNREHARQLAALKARYKPGEPVETVSEIQIGVLKGPDWLFSNENPCTRLEGTIARLRAYRALGTKTQEKSLSDLMKLTQGAREDLSIAETALLQIRTAADFFAADNLLRLATWANVTFAETGSFIAEGTSLTVCDHGQLVCKLSFDPSDALAGTSFLDLYQP